MRFLADEGVDRAVVLHLRKLGYVVDYVAELAPSLPDDEVLVMANNSGAVLITQDKDFGEIVFRQHRLTEGVLLLRLAGLSSADKATLVGFVVTGHADEVGGAFSVLSATGFRVRRLRQE